MDDTQSTDEQHRSVDPQVQGQDPVAALAYLDPADSPPAAESYAASLAAELEEAGAPSRDPVQIQADLGAESEI